MWIYPANKMDLHLRLQQRDDTQRVLGIKTVVSHTPLHVHSTQTHRRKEWLFYLDRRRQRQQHIHRLVCYNMHVCVNYTTDTYARTRRTTAARRAQREHQHARPNTVSRTDFNDSANQTIRSVWSSGARARSQLLSIWVYLTTAASASSSCMAWSRSRRSRRSASCSQMRAYISREKRRLVLCWNQPCEWINIPNLRKCFEHISECNLDTLWYWDKVFFIMTLNATTGWCKHGIR